MLQFSNKICHFVSSHLFEITCSVVLSFLKTISYYKCNFNICVSYYRLFVCDVLTFPKDGLILLI